MAKDDEHSSLDDLADFLDPLHVDDFLYGNDDGYTTLEESITADIMESEQKRSSTNNDYEFDEDEDDENEFDEEDDTEDDFGEYDSETEDNRLVDEETETIEDCSIEVQDYASEQYQTRVSADFLIRDYDNEKKLGVENISFYAYWIPDSVGALVIVGELYTKKPLKLPLTICVEEYDKDDDLIQIYDCFDYTGSSGISERAIRPQTVFNRYPFEVELHFDEKKISDNSFKLILKPDNDEDVDDIDEFIEESEGIETTCTLDIEKELSLIDPSMHVFIARMQEGEKIPKDLIRHYVESYSGLSEVKCVFVKAHKNDSPYWANQLNYSLLLNGKPENDLLAYYLFYNEKKELIDYWVERIDGGKNYNHKHYQSFANFPPCEKICRVIVYVGPHPLNYLGDEFFTNLLR